MYCVRLLSENTHRSSVIEIIDKIAHFYFLFLFLCQSPSDSSVAPLQLIFLASGLSYVQFDCWIVTLCRWNVKFASHHGPLRGCQGHQTSCCALWQRSFAGIYGSMATRNWLLGGIPLTRWKQASLWWLTRIRGCNHSNYYVIAW